MHPAVRLRRRPALGSALALLALAAPLPLAAQERDRPETPPRPSLFRLAGEGDLARTSMRQTGDWVGMDINSGWMDDFGGPGIGCWAAIAPRLRPTSLVCQFFGIGSPMFGAPASEWRKHLARVPSLAHVKPEGSAKGYTAIINLTSFGEPRQINAADGQFGVLYSGVTTTTDGSCRDHSQVRGGFGFPAGLTLLPGSNCPPTWPVVNGVPTFLGSHPIPQRSWEQVFQNPALAGMTRETFQFDWWRVPKELQDRSRFFGDFATYGRANDYNRTTLSQFGRVIPGQSGEPVLPGWPLGLQYEYDAFTYFLPTLSGVVFWRAILINNSEKVYGVPLDYDSLYIGWAHETFRRQNGSMYLDTRRNTIFSAELGTSGTPNCNGARAIPGGPGCTVRDGFGLGATAIVVLKSPIGDMRNKLFSDPTSPFYDPQNRHRGDTITVNHMHLCDYGFCFTTFGGLERDPRKLFGFYSSSWRNILHKQSLSDFNPVDVAMTFRNPFYPDSLVPFAYYVPGREPAGSPTRAPVWTYTRRPRGAPVGPDTIWADNCGPRGCSDVWSDTMAWPGKYVNREANNGMFGVGPFRLAAGDTVGVVIAMVGANDSATIMRLVDETIRFYNKFYLGPSAAPPVRIVGRQVEGHDVAGPNAARVTLFFNDTLETFVDPFLLDFAETLEKAGGRLLRMNPKLPQQIRERARDNVARMLIFKSCDGGRTFTRDADCAGDPARGLDGQPIGTGWQAYAQFEPVNGEFPNSFTDDAVIAGRSYLYVIAAETRGARFAIVDSVDTDGNGVLDAVAPAELNLAPQILNALSTSTSEPNVASVYVPASGMAGSVAARLELAPQPGASPATMPLVARRAGTVQGGDFRILFGNRITLVRRSDARTDSVRSTQVIVEDVIPQAVRDPGGANQQLLTDVVLRTDTFTTTAREGVTVAGPVTPVSDQVVGSERVVVRRIAALALVLLDPRGRPLLVSSSLAPDRTTPGSFFNRGDFPGFVLSADAARPGELERAGYVSASGQPVSAEVAPTFRWNAEASSAGPLHDQLGRYLLTFTGPVFGTGAPFRIQPLDPAATDAAFDQSLRARTAGTTGLTDAATLELLRRALNRPGLQASDLVPVRVPFTIRNTTFDREVQVAMLARSDSTMLLGSGADTVRVTIPRDEWVPGDPLIFLETVTRDSVVGGRVVVDAQGRPIKITGRQVTLVSAVLDCGRERPRCNPVVGRGATSFLDAEQGLGFEAIYRNPFDIETAFVLKAGAALTGRDILTQKASIGSLERVLVAPNPYVVYSPYERQAGEPRVVFQNLPPEGTLRIYTSTGEFLQEIRWGPEDLQGNGDLFYNLRTHEGNELASGLYVFVVSATDPATGQLRKKIGKFVVIQRR